MWLIAKGRLVSLLTTSISPLTGAALRKSDPMPPSPPSLETLAANSADVHVPMGARMIGTSIPNTSQSGVFSIVPSPKEQRQLRAAPTATLLPHRRVQP